MNKLKSFIPMSALALGLLFTNCVDNTESDGVNAMRVAQADLITAKAESERLKAEADAALASANAELAQATLQNVLLENQIKEIELKTKQLELDLASAETEAEIALIEMQLEVQKAEQQALLVEANAAIEKATNEANIALLEAEEKMIAATTSLEVAIAAASVENREALTLLKDEYAGFLGDIVNKQNEIIGVETELAYYAIYEGFGLSSEQDKKIIELNKAELEGRKEIIEAWIVDYEAINVSNDNEQLYLAARVDSIDFENQILKLEEEKVLLQNSADKAEDDKDNASDTMDDLEDAMDEANDLYYVAKANQDYVTDLGNTTDVKSVSLSSLKDEDGETFDFVLMLDYQLNDYVNGLSTIYSLKYYEDMIDATLGTDDEADYTAQKAFAVKVRDYLSSYWSVSDRKATYDVAREDYLDAATAYTQAVQLYEDANDVVADKGTEISLVKDNHNYNNEYIDALYGTKENVEELIRDAKEDLIDVEEQLQAIEINAIEWAALTETKETELATLKVELEVLENQAASVKAEIDDLLSL